MEAPLRLGPNPHRPTGVDVGLVAAGGALGTGARYGLGAVIPHWSGVPVATLVVNVVGAFLLGLLLESLLHRVGDPERGRRLRLGVGTGVLGGFTTYSALATDTAVLAASQPALAIGYGLGTVVLGAVASVTGVWVGRGRR